MSKWECPCGGQIARSSRTFVNNTHTGRFPAIEWLRLYVSLAFILTLNLVESIDLKRAPPPPSLLVEGCFTASHLERWLGKLRRDQHCQVLKRSSWSTWFWGTRNLNYPSSGEGREIPQSWFLAIPDFHSSEDFQIFSHFTLIFCCFSLCLNIF